MMSKSDAHNGLAIRTGSRLHFGLLDTVAPFGGVGVMIESPTVEVIITPADRFECDDQERVVPIINRVMTFAGRSESPKCKIRIPNRPPSHCGLGSGTQLSLAVAEAICRFQGLSVTPIQMACDLADRGKRSAVGVHGYFHGGLIYEHGATEVDAGASQLNPLVQRVDMPGDWRVGLFQPAGFTESVSGSVETQKFARLKPATSGQMSELESIAFSRLLPAVDVGDFAAFSAALHDYNHASGLLFEAVQGGAYHGDSTTDLVHRIRDFGVSGVGQSSWGPGVFAWFEDSASADATIASMTDAGLPKPLFVTSAKAAGRVVEIASG